MKIVHASDLHLDSPLRGLPLRPGVDRSAFQKASRKTLRRLVDLCLAQRAALLVLSGDLVDASRRSVSTGLFFIEQMLRLEATSTEVVMVRGNHDAANPTVPCWLLPQFVKQLGVEGSETHRYDGLGVAVHGASYPARRTPFSLLATYPSPVPSYANFGLLHTSAEGREGHESYAPCTRRQLKERGYDYFALGHVHRPEVLSRTPWVVFSGTPQGRAIRDTGPRGAVIVNVAGTKVVRVEFVALDVVRFVSVAVSLENVRVLDDLLEAVAASMPAVCGSITYRALVVRLVLQGPALSVLLSSPVGWRAELLVRAVAPSAPVPVWLESVWAELMVPAPYRFRLDAPAPTLEVG